MRQVQQNSEIKPFLKWAGGKRYLLPEIRKRIPKFKCYCELFLGGGAVLFDCKPSQAIINDSNSEVMNVYSTIKTNVNELIKELKKYKNEAEHYYKVREADRFPLKYCNMTAIQKAARIIYLNKTCYNGLFRVNSQGQFNAPFGRYKNPNIVNAEVLKAVSDYFNKNDIRIYQKSFEELIDTIPAGSFVYLDPPYDPISDTSCFTGYNINGFNREDQKKLKNFCDELNNRKIKFLLSNSSTDFIKNLYSKYKISDVKAPRAINSISTKRGEISEVLIQNYDI